MMTKLDCSFTFHPVGQGLFYSGRVNTFHFVYDCGTDSGSRYLQAAIDAYEAPGSPLHLLIISHFHADHMNGVKELLKKTHGVKEVVLPYLFPAERLMAAAGYAIANDLDSLPNDYVGFLDNPVSYLQENHAADAKITLLSSGAAITDWPNPEGQATEEDEWYPEKSARRPNRAEDLLYTPNVVFRKHSSVYRAPRWEFKFYCQPGQATAVEIKAELNSLKSPIELDDIPNVIGKRLNDLKDVYHSLFGGSAGQNSTSVVCCHGPVMPRGNRMHQLHGRARVGVQLSPCSPACAHRDGLDCGFGGFFCDCRRARHRAGRHPFLLPPLQLLTGDANLKTRQVKTHFVQELGAIGLTLLPHHGSKHNWRTSFPTLMPNCQLYVASSGLGNRHKHPNKTVIDAVVAVDGHVAICSEVQGITIKIDAWRSP